MTALAIEPARTLPNGRLYHSPWGLILFQEEGVARVVVGTNNTMIGKLAIWDTGLGKTHLAMASAALLYELGLVDQVIICCERNKVAEWIEDFEKFTALSVGKFYGPKRKRLYVDMPQVIVTVYETMKIEAAGPKGKRVGPGGPLTEAMRHRRVFLVYDEAPKLSGRGSELYKAHEFFIHAVRTDGHLRMLGLTATPTEKGDSEGYFNLWRILSPTRVGTVGWFEAEFVKYRDNFGRPKYTRWKLPEFANCVAPDVLRKRKTDEDVRHQFPAQVEEATHVSMGEAQRAFYKAVASLYDAPEGEFDARTPEQVEQHDRELVSVLRLAAGHPAAIARAQGKLARAITERIGADGLKAIGSAKTVELIARLKKLVRSQGDQVVVFTFFANTVLPVLLEELRGAGFSVVEHHSGLPENQQYEAQRMFKAGQAQIFLTSDAGARGLNFPNAQYVEHYEAAGKHDTYVQRMSRVNRMQDPNSTDHGTVTSNVFITEDSIEVGIAQSAMRRNAESEQIVDGGAVEDEFYVSAAMRRSLLGLR